MIIRIIILAINLGIGAFVFYRCGRQSAYNNLVRAYKKVCQSEERLWRAIDMLEQKNTCDGKEENK